MPRDHPSRMILDLVFFRGANRVRDSAGTAGPAKTCAHILGYHPFLQPFFSCAQKRLRLSNKIMMNGPERAQTSHYPSPSSPDAIQDCASTLQGCRTTACNSSCRSYARDRDQFTLVFVTPECPTR
ncbi:hypothetical protein ASPTUDRAFT_689244 [Aspergillus tubingensis CBS 134.48]|uniref:Uncharacterized protein n=1 Tax=Aspergillus tubingensis (strain CBS 134.48) TaxID=767770 RepID=A0A1L9N0A3_ASPTC|nr:hypothetical protein ASPTUDRAFT_689244 [Aspergillus tubingensis CBS 134.48]